ncbi:MAG: hypothetical protein FVQ82_01300 [Planctomycetes bacterium]|nr:hypothetical protein [Planctomycetota bacterium]
MSTAFLSPIIKSSKVNVEGVFQLPIGSLAIGSVPADEGKPPSEDAQASARVIETTAEYATIEVVCPCGTVSQIKCNYN